MEVILLPILLPPLVVVVVVVVEVVAVIVAVVVVGWVNLIECISPASCRADSRLAARVISSCGSISSMNTRTSNSTSTSSTMEYILPASCRAGSRPAASSAGSVASSAARPEACEQTQASSVTTRARPAAASASWRAARMAAWSPSASAPRRVASACCACGRGVGVRVKGGALQGQPSQHRGDPPTGLRLLRLQEGG